MKPRFKPHYLTLFIRINPDEYYPKQYFFPFRFTLCKKALFNAIAY